MEKQRTLSQEDIVEFDKNGFIGPFKIYDEKFMDEAWKALRVQLLNRENAIYQVPSSMGNTNVGNYDCSGIVNLAA